MRHALLAAAAFGAATPAHAIDAPIAWGQRVDEAIVVDETDVYRFTAPPGSEIYVDAIAASNPSQTGWQVVDACGRTIASAPNLFSDLGRVRLIGGDYRLEVYNVSRGVGSYSLAVHLGQIVDAGVLLADVEVEAVHTTPGSTRIYTFDARPGDRVYLDVRDALTSWDWDWQLFDPAGRRVATDRWLDDGPFDLQAGPHRLELRNTGTAIGTQRFILHRAVPEAHVGQVGVVHSEDLAQPGTFHDWTYALGATGLRSFDVATFQNRNGLRVDLYDGYDQLVSTRSSAAPFETLPLLAGDWRFRVHRLDDDPNAYAIVLADLRDLDGELLLNAAMSGTLDTVGQRAVYRFDTPIPARFWMSPVANRGDVSWQVIDVAGRVVASDDDLVYSGPYFVPAGSYTVLIDPEGDATGAVAFSLIDPIDLPVLSGGLGPVSGAVAPAQTWQYRFLNPVAQQVRWTYVSGTGSSSDWSLELVDSAGRVLATATSIGTQTAWPLTAGEYVVRVRHDRAVSASFSASLGASGAVTPPSPGAAVALGGTATGSITSAATASHTLTLGATTQVVFHARQTSSSLRWRLVDAAGMDVWAEGGASSGSDAARGPFALRPGSYTLILRSTSSTPTAYAVDVVEVLPAASTAVAIGEDVTRTFTRVGETAEYTFTVDAPDLLYFDTSGDDRDCVWSVYDSVGGAVFTRRLMRSSDDAGGEPYALAAGTYRVVVDPEAASLPVCAFRVVDVVQTSQVIGVDDEVCGDILTPGGTATYYVDVQEGDRFYFDVTSDSDSDWTLRDPAGLVYADRARMGDPDDEGIGRFITRAGTWSIEVDADVDDVPSFCFAVRPIASPIVRPLTLDRTTQDFIVTPGQDLIYEFTLSRETRIYFDNLFDTTWGRWTLTDDAGTTRFKDADLGQDSNDQGPLDLLPGRYELAVSVAGGNFGLFSFNARTVQDVSHAAAVDDLFAHRNALPGEDHLYVFDVDTCTEVQLDLREGGDLQWTLVDERGVVIVPEGFAWENDPGEHDAGPFPLGPGAYTVRVNPIGDELENWTFRINDPDPAKTTLVFTAYRYGTHQVRSVEVGWDGARLDVGLFRELLDTDIPRGLAWTPSGELLVPGQQDLFFVDPRGGGRDVGNVRREDHRVEIDPSGARAWVTNGRASSLYEVTLSNSPVVVERPLFGSDVVLADLGFDDQSRAWYVANGNIGRLDLASFTTTRLGAAIPGAAELTWDPFSETFLVFGTDAIAQFDPDTLTIVSRLDVPAARFTGGATNGAGLLFAAATQGALWAVDYAATGRVGDPSTRVGAEVIDPELGALAPLSWLGGPCVGGPRVTDLRPASGDRLPTGPIVLSGKARALDPTRRVQAVLVDGVPVAALDGAGGFFETVTLEDGPNEVVIEAFDRCGSTRVVWTASGDDALVDGGDPTARYDALTGTVSTAWERTTFATDTDRLVVSVQVRNDGQDALTGPLYVAPGPELHPTIALVDPDGASPDGAGWVEVVPPGERLAADATSAARRIAFANPSRYPVAFTPVVYGATNTAPVFTSTPRVEVEVGEAWAWPVEVVDAEGDAWTLTLAAGPPAMVWDPVAGVLAWTPEPADVGLHRVVVVVVDAAGATATQELTLRVAADLGNRPPVISSAPPTSAPSGAALYTYDVAAFDPDGDALSWSLVGPPSASVVGGQVRWPSPPVGEQAFTVVVRDGRGGEAAQSFTVAVGTGDPANPHVPQITSSAPAQAVVGIPYVYQPVAFDADQDPLVWALTLGPAGATVDIDRGRVVWTPTAGQTGDHVLTVVAVDGRGGVAQQTWIVRVAATAANLPPAIVSVPTTAAVVGLTWQYAAAADDPEFDPFTWSLDEAPVGATVDPATGLVRWTPTAVGEVAFALVARDVGGNRAEQAFRVAVRASNGGPVIAAWDPYGVVAVGQEWVVDLDAVDPDGDRLRWALVDGPAGVQVGAPDGRVRWTPTLPQVGRWTVVVRVTDPFGASDEVSLPVTAVPEDRPPVVVVAPDRTPVCVGEAIRVCAGAADNVGVASVRLDVDGVDWPLDGARCAALVYPTAGVRTARATAVDVNGNVATASTAVEWRACGG